MGSEMCIRDRADLDEKVENLALVMSNYGARSRGLARTAPSASFGGSIAASTATAARLTIVGRASWCGSIHSRLESHVESSSTGRYTSAGFLCGRDDTEAASQAMREGQQGELDVEQATGRRADDGQFRQNARGHRHVQRSNTKDP